jgi:hypothetical protein
VLPVERILASHIDPDLGKFAVAGREEIAVGFVDHAVIMKRVGDTKTHCDISAIACIDKMELIMSDCGVMAPQPLKHAADLVMSK